MNHSSLLSGRFAAALLTLLSITISSSAIAQSGTRRAPTRSSQSMQRSTTPSRSIKTPPSGVAVVELFTSQGCSSCPPADVALQKIATVAKENKLPVFVLSFHVDYWNRLGWTDPYSDQSFTNRQRAYASAIGKRGPYTPQMIVGGRTEFVGSDQSKAHQAITTALGRRALSTVSLKVDPASSNGQLEINYKVGGIHQGRLLNVALVDSPHANKVPRGENGGRTLGHVNVVRAFQTVKLDDATGTVDLKLPEELSLADAQVVAYVQDPKSLAITGAAAVNAGS